MDKFEVPESATDLRAVLGVAMGYVSVCWQYPSSGGVFLSSQAEDCLDAVVKWCQDRGWTAGAALAVEERERQIRVEGHTPDRDAENGSDDIARAAACYALPREHRWYPDGAAMTPTPWPWRGIDWKPLPGDRKRELVKAAGLAIAALDQFLAEEKDKETA